MEVSGSNSFKILTEFEFPKKLTISFNPNPPFWEKFFFSKATILVTS